MDAVGPPDLRMICNGTDIRYAKAQLFSRLTVRKNIVYIDHDRRGITGAFMKNDAAPADHERKLGSVNTETVTNWTKVIKGPAAGSSLIKSIISFM